VVVEADGCAPGETVAFDDDPHAASAITAAAPTANVANLRFFNAFIVFIILVPITREARPGFGYRLRYVRPPTSVHESCGLRRIYDRSVQPVDLLLVSGSLQRVSANRALLAVAASCAEADARVAWFEGIADIPHFNPDLTDDLEPVVAWRRAIGRADCLLIASPEYAHSLPGSLKNALDWLVGAGELYEKPVGLMSAGLSGGRRALDALTQTLHAQGARVVGQLEVAGVRPKQDTDGNIVDADTIAQTCALVTDLVQAARRSSVAPPLTNESS